jgi:hypothetical protein
MIIKNDKCELEILLNHRGYANVYYDVNLVSGEWPTHIELIVACDNGAFGGPDRTFGGDVQNRHEKRKYVTVYVD